VEAGGFWDFGVDQCHVRVSPEHSPGLLSWLLINATHGCWRSSINLRQD
jgi:hypothetical protein